MSQSYTSLAKYYDRLNCDVDYIGWADFIHKRLCDHGIKDGSLVLDLACGTGNIAIPLAKLGYDVIGADLSPEMLEEAFFKSQNEDVNILWLCQDMRSFELYGTVGAVVCCLDSMNYLTGKQGFLKCLSLVHNYLDPNGIFIFDVNTPYKFKNIYGNNHYIIEADGVYCGWKNYYDPKSALCDFELSLFIENESGLYERHNELQRERCYSRSFIETALEKSGFELISVVSDFEMKPASDSDERWFFICKAIKEPVE